MSSFSSNSFRAGLLKLKDLVHTPVSSMPSFAIGVVAFAVVVMLKYIVKRVVLKIIQTIHKLFTDNFIILLDLFY